MLPADVSETRSALDELDHALLDLIARRRALVGALFVKKRALGLPLVDPMREVELLADRRVYAERQGVPADLAEVIFRAILEDSHTRT
ncbi:chorismate mutase [Polyangium mundeleinium]|uniref:chorismate mutase n=1 Tax=Polyangium mundeleinium TaxID=2995306 RepID=A0ABT5F3Q8_9BACT|nr:chorismate mutase [Polyangium mundeleinium]MDC0748244.1 chorismate mutase [Polyangium mundeleinium]